MIFVSSSNYFVIIVFILCILYIFVYLNLISISRRIVYSLDILNLKRYFDVVSKNIFHNKKN